MASLFISYRRDDRPGFAGRLAEALEKVFGPENVFRDIEDIGPGEDFVEVIERQLRDVDTMLVVIGPAWLTANSNGVRRLDEPKDFVREEIRAGLQSARHVLPVLVGGAAMPSEADLPLDIRPLGRRQAVVLSDANWSADVARLIETVSEFVPPRNARPTWRNRGYAFVRGLAIGMAASALLALLTPGAMKDWPLYTRLGKPLIFLSSTTSKALNGRWSARVRYDWDASYAETFELTADAHADGSIHGTASYLKEPRIIENGRLQTDRITFVTHSRDIQGDAPPRDVTHHYRGTLVGDELHFVLETSGGYASHTPVEFVARRVPK